jgi:hypothetical protein
VDERQDGDSRLIFITAIFVPIAMGVMLAETMVATFEESPAMASGGGMGGVDYRSAKTSSRGGRRPLITGGTVDARFWRGPSQN